MALKIDPIPRNLIAPVGVLARAGHRFRGVFVELAGGRPVDEIVAERGQALELAEKALDRWVTHLGLEVEEAVREKNKGVGENTKGTQLFYLAALLFGLHPVVNCPYPSKRTTFVYDSKRLTGPCLGCVTTIVYESKVRLVTFRGDEDGPED